MSGYFYSAFESFVMLNRTTEETTSGGYETVWSDGATIQAALSLGQAQETRQAEASGLKKVYTATFPIDTPVRYDTYLRRVETGEIFRVTSDPRDNRTPATAVYQSCFATAERTELPND